VTLRLIGSLGRTACQIVISLYDLFIMVPLGVERLIKARRAEHRPEDDWDDEPALLESKRIRNQSTADV